MLKNNVGAVQRKTSGPLTTRALDGIIRADHIHAKESEYLQTLFVAVPKKDQQDFESHYEDLTVEDPKEGDMFPNTVGMCVVPNSADVVIEDNEHILYSVVLLKKKVQDFKKACSISSRRWIVREFEFNAKRYELAQMEAEDLQEKIETMKKDLYEWTKTAFSECYSGWLHLKAIRIFVESVLRYGLPPQFCTLLLKVTRNETKIHKYFRDNYKHLLSDQPTAVDDESTLGFGQLHGMEFHPYVLLTLNVNQYPLLKMT